MKIHLFSGKKHFKLSVVTLLKGKIWNFVNFYHCFYTSNNDAGLIISKLIKHKKITVICIKVQKN